MRNPKLRRTAAQPAAGPAAAKISTEADDRTDGAGPAAVPGFGAYLRCFLGLATWGFVGPLASVGVLHRDLVERRGGHSGTEGPPGGRLCQTHAVPLGGPSVLSGGSSPR